MTLKDAFRIVLELAAENMIDPREGDEYAEERAEQAAALSMIAEHADAACGESVLPD